MVNGELVRLAGLYKQYEDSERLKRQQEELEEKRQKELRDLEWKATITEVARQNGISYEEAEALLQRTTRGAAGVALVVAVVTTVLTIMERFKPEWFPKPKPQEWDFVPVRGGIKFE